jgi:hypothetical protein
MKPKKIFTDPAKPILTYMTNLTCMTNLTFMTNLTSLTESNKTFNPQTPAAGKLPCKNRWFYFTKILTL